MLSLRQLIGEELRQYIGEMMPGILPRLILSEHLKPCYSRDDTDYASSVGFLDQALDLDSLSRVLASRLNSHLQNYYLQNYYLHNHYAQQFCSRTFPTLENTDISDSTDRCDSNCTDLITVYLHQHRWLNFKIHWRLIGYWLWNLAPANDFSSAMLTYGTTSWTMVYGWQRCHSVLQQLDNEPAAAMFAHAVTVMETQQILAQRELHYQKLLKLANSKQRSPNLSVNYQKSFPELVRALSLRLIYLGDAGIGKTAIDAAKEANLLAHSFLSIHDQIAILALSTSERWWYGLLAKQTRECLEFLVPDLKAYI